jgi:hypothetical protein
VQERHVASDRVTPAALVSYWRATAARLDAMDEYSLRSAVAALQDCADELEASLEDMAREWRAGATPRPTDNDAQHKIRMAVAACADDLLPETASDAAG